MVLLEVSPDSLDKNSIRVDEEISVFLVYELIIFEEEQKAILSCFTQRISIDSRNGLFEVDSPPFRFLLFCFVGLSQAQVRR
jgi:hypothetical protein